MLTNLLCEHEYSTRIVHKNFPERFSIRLSQKPLQDQQISVKILWHMTFTMTTPA